MPPPLRAGSGAGSCLRLDSPMDARAHVADLVGKTVHTVGRDKPNRILEIKGTDVIVATD